MGGQDEVNGQRFAAPIELNHGRGLAAPALLSHGRRLATPALLSNGRRFAAPSWVLPGNLAENCRFLAGRVNEVGLLFFEAEACLNYTQNDLPSWLAELPLNWHVHLPVDLPWEASGTASAKTCLKLMDKLDFLQVRRAVLHPPPAPDWIENFISLWQRAGRNPTDLLLENLPQHTPGELANLAKRLNCSICFDFGHFLLHNTCKICDVADGSWLETTLSELESAFPYVKLVHWCAPYRPKPGDNSAGRHAPLTALGSAERQLAARIAQSLAADTVFMLELFNWEEIVSSLPLLQKWSGGATFSDTSEA